MKKTKDFLYNWNDILVIILILIVAAVLILWRVGIIMDYPKYMAAQAQEKAMAEKEAAEALTPVTPSETGTPSTTGSSGSSTGSTSTEEEAEPGSGPKNGRLWSGGMLREEVSVTTASGSASDAAQSLVDAGLFTSYEDFAAICEYNGFDPTDIKANDFTFPPGTTQAQIAEEVTKPMG